MTIPEYIARQDAAVRPRLTEIYELLQSTLPEAEERISWSMPTFWKGRTIIHFAPAKKHLGLYPGGEATAVFAHRLAEYDVSKGTVRFPWNQPLPKELIAEIAQWCYEHNRK